MPETRILVVDDEPDICEILQFNLENAGFIVDVAYSAEKALEILTPSHNLILLDIMMGGMSGLKMAKIVRKELNLSTPIIFLTAKSSENDLLTGFSAGADDYIVKPFSLHEVMARIQAVLRRSTSVNINTANKDLIEIGEIKIDKKTKMVFAGSDAITLSKKEFEILCLLAEHPGKVFSREDIISQLWQDAPYILERTVDVHITRIRSKLGPYKNYISNRTGFGYCFNIQ